MGLEVVRRSPCEVRQDHDKLAGRRSQGRVDTEAVIVDSARSLGRKIDEFKFTIHSWIIVPISYNRWPNMMSNFVFALPIIFIADYHLEFSVELLGHHRGKENIEASESGRRQNYRDVHAISPYPISAAHSE